MSESREPEERLFEQVLALPAAERSRFLDEVCDRTWEVVDGNVEEYDGGYSAYALSKAERTRQGAAAAEFTAMITAVNEWAMTKNSPPWVHPLPSIRAALDRKAQGRVFQTDENEPVKPPGISAGEWKKFTDRAVFEDLYFDWEVQDD